MKNFINDGSVQKIVKDTLHNCDDGELYLEDSLNESFLFDDNVLKNSSIVVRTKAFVCGKFSDVGVARFTRVRRGGVKTLQYPVRAA